MVKPGGVARSRGGGKESEVGAMATEAGGDGYDVVESSSF